MCNGKQVLERGISPFVLLSLLLVDDSVHIFFHLRECPELFLIKQGLSFYFFDVGHELIDIEIIQPLGFFPCIFNQFIQSGMSRGNLAVESILHLFFQRFKGPKLSLSDPSNTLLHLYGELEHHLLLPPQHELHYALLHVHDLSEVCPIRECLHPQVQQGQPQGLEALVHLRFQGR